MLKIKFLEAAELIGFSLEYKAQAMSAVCVFKSAFNVAEIFKRRGAFCFAKAEKLTEGTALAYFNRALLPASV